MDSSEILASLRRQEVSQIEAENLTLIKQFSDAYKSVNDPIQQVRAVVNACSRIFTSLDQWNLSFNTRRKMMEAHLQNTYQQISLENKTICRDEFANKVIGSCKDPELSKRYWKYLNQVLT